MSAKHTPGPWTAKVVHFNGAGAILGPDNKGVACISAAVRREENESNLRLIAAAPDLLAALQRIVRARQDGAIHPDDPCIDAARAAIAKAKGEA